MLEYGDMPLLRGTLLKWSGIIGISFSNMCGIMDTN